MVDKSLMAWNDQNIASPFPHSSLGKCFLKPKGLGFGLRQPLSCLAKKGEPPEIRPVVIWKSIANFLETGNGGLVFRFISNLRQAMYSAFFMELIKSFFWILFNRLGVLSKSHWSDYKAHFFSRQIWTIRSTLALRKDILSAFLLMRLDNSHSAIYRSSFLPDILQVPLSGTWSWLT